jgi:anti-sigma B factor antagonist
MAQDTLRIASSRGERGQTIFSLEGPLNIHTVFTFQDAVRSDASPILIIDFTGVPFIDSAGLGAMVGAAVSTRKASRKIVFAAMNKQARVLVEMTRVNQHLHMYDTVKDAEAAVH